MNRHTATAALVFLCALHSSHAQDANIYAEQHKLVTSGPVVSGLGTDLFGDQVNTYTGSLSFRHVDISLPGNDALPMQLGRRFGVGKGGLMNGHFGDWDIDLPSIGGVFATGSSAYGKNYGFAVDQPEPYAYERCTGFGEPPQGYPNKGLST